MSKEHQIKDAVQFTERTTVSKEQSSIQLFDILEEDVLNNKQYCQLLLNKLLLVPYAKLPDFFSHHCQIASNPLKWLNKFEKLIAENEYLFISTTNRGRMIKCYTIIERKRKEIELNNNKKSTKFLIQYINAGCEARCFSFKETREKASELSNYTDKIIFLTKEKYDYEQAIIDFINPKLPDFAIQCQKEIDHIQQLNCLTNEFSVDQMQSKTTPLPFNKLKINCNINQLVDIYYRLSREMHTNGRPIIEGSISDLATVIVNSFVDKDGRDLSLETVKTVLTPSKHDKRPKDHKKINIDTTNL
ncbi:hypothetical protein [Sphingobacterium sp. DR205]|uniref:hypothetical protein n=1 Tax=Sphingobacterium sp. DR205 TaxID=2713573 RepID=UPI0013E42E27|nr:hypothetical protein [Sphingobacterium sp. DR205]QIH33436.1 hypothetical protein G6053_11310 [Sphingobacterium sp. DR205]